MSYNFFLSSHLGDGYFCTLVDELHHIVGLALVRRYEEALGECEDLSGILLAHEVGRSEGRRSSRSASGDPDGLRRRF